MTSSPVYSPDVNTIWDFRKSDTSSVEVNLIERLVEFRKQLSQRLDCRSVLLVSDELQYSLSSMYKKHVENDVPHDLMVFREYEEAEKWILEDKGD